MNNKDLLLSLEEIKRAAENQQQQAKKIIADHEKFEKRFFQKFFKFVIDR